MKRPSAGLRLGVILLILIGLLAPGTATGAGAQIFNCEDLTATQAQAFRRVIAPLAAPGVFTTAILVFIFCWNDFLFAITLTSTERSRTVPVALQFFTGESQFEDPTGAICAAAVVITVPIILFVLFFQRRIVSGLTSGAVKG